MDEVGAPDEFEALKQITAALQPLVPEARKRILQYVAAFFEIGELPPGATRMARGEADLGGTRFSDEREISPKEFILDKQPRTDVERVACLGYYLAHYRGTPRFRTLDVSKLNTEAAQPKFSNSAWAVNNAVKQRYLVPGPQGTRQLSAIGEQFVRALPDRDAARAILETHRPRRSSRKRRTTAAKVDLGPHG